ncbi:MAG: hypothetical protein OEU91_01075 [Gammaproteobacteria bacterium]|nr:hypothetical protein [Gammaproteobacteria bacterium]
MKHPTSRISLIIAAVLGMASVTSNAALPPLQTSPITFDPQGTGGDNGVLISTFDWSVNTILFKGAVDPASGDVNTADQVMTYRHAALQGTQDPDGNPLGLFGLNSNYEVTMVMGWPLKIMQNGASRLDLSFSNATDNENDENFVRFYRDSNVNSSALEGTGYTDGDVILEGAILWDTPFETYYSGSFADENNSGLLDAFGTDNWGSTTTPFVGGAEQARILVSDFDPNYFPDLEKGSIIDFTTQLELNYNETNPSRNMDTDTGTTASTPGNINWTSGTDGMNQTDPNNAFQPAEIVDGVGCRVTGGGNDTSGLSPLGIAGWDGTPASGSFAVTETVVKVMGNSGRVSVTEETSYDVYTFGGQAGANTGQQPQPKGELEHVNHAGPSGQWAFHMGTASAPPGTEIDIIQCSDPGWCRQARPAPAKQIDFAGIGTFRNIIDEGNLNGGGDCASVTTLHGKPSERGLGTYNWAEIHIEDHGEFGREGQHVIADPVQCPAEGTGTDAFSSYNGAGSRVDAVLTGTYNEFTCKTDNDPSTECPDFYRIRIYCGVEPEFDADGNLDNFDAIAAEKINGPIYEVFGYIDGGNWQIHPPTGFDLRQ